MLNVEKDYYCHCCGITEGLESNENYICLELVNTVNLVQLRCGLDFYET